MRSPSLSPMNLYLGGLLSWFGAIGIQTVLFPYLVIDLLGKGPTELGVAMMALFLPTMLLILLGGATADHVDGRRILTLVHFLAGLPSLLLTFVFLSGGLTYEVLIVYALAMGVAGAFIIPARDSLLTHIADGKIQKTVMAATAFQFGAQIIGFGLAASAAWTGLAAVLLTQVALLWMGGLLALRLPVHKPEGGSAPSLAAIADGFREVVGNAQLFAPTAIVFGVGILFFGTSQVVLPFIIQDVFLEEGQDLKVQLAIVNVVMMCGIVISATLIGRLGGIERQGRALVLALGFGAFVMASFGFVPTFWTLSLATFAWGCGGGVAMTMNRTIIQESAPASHRGRILAVFQMGVLGGAPVGAFLSGFYVEWWGPQNAVLLPAAGMLVMLALACLATPIWGIQSPSASAAAD